MLAIEHQLAVLVVYRGPGRHLTGVAVRGQIDYLQLRVQRVAGVDLGQEFARNAGEGDEDVADLLGEQGGSRSRECQHLQPVDDGRWCGHGCGRTRRCSGWGGCRRTLLGTP